MMVAHRQQKLVNHNIVPSAAFSMICSEMSKFDSTTYEVTQITYY